MKVALYSTLSLNGMIAKEDGSEDFLSDESWNIFADLAHEFGCFVVGRKTFDLVSKWKEYNFSSVKAKLIVISKEKSGSKGVIWVKSPKEAIKKAESLGFKKILVAGGSSLYTAFIKEKLLDEIYFTLEPVIVGRGISVFSAEDFQVKLKLKECKKTSSGSLKLHYLANQK